jgi:glycerol-3-phosphate O-acyltransferase / dihydroxyacetone phosphate acyltransferase
MRILGHLFYRYLWISFNTLLFYFYRFSRWKHIEGVENIPNDRPVIFCSNHPNAFMDALLIGSAFKRRSWFLARSDVFRKKWLANFLGFIGIIPIYRLLEGAENLSKNDETFDKCARMLEQNKAILIFSEGLCIQERRLRKLKKGTARIAFGTEEKNNFSLNLTIVPVGINYSATPWKFRTPMHIRVGKPFPMSDYRALYEKDKARAMNQFTRDLEEKMKEQLLIIEHKENDKLVAQAEELLVAERAEKARVNSKNQRATFEISRTLAKKINQITNEDSEKADQIREKTKLYFDELKKLRLRDWLVRKSPGLGFVFGQMLIGILFFPFWLFGAVTNYVPYKIPWMIQKKIVKHIEWSASVNGTIGVFLWQFWWLILSLVVALAFRNWYVLGAFMILMPLSGTIAQWYTVQMKKMFGAIRWRGVKQDKKTEFAQKRKDLAREF